MNSVKIAYIVCATVVNFLLIVMAILVQVYDVPAANWWTGYLIFIVSGSSHPAVGWAKKYANKAKKPHCLVANSFGGVIQSTVSKGYVAGWVFIHAD